MSRTRCSAELEERLNALTADAIESGAYDHGVETVHADSLVLAAREPVFVHEETGAATELCEIKRSDKLIPLTADAALALSPRAAAQAPRLMTNDRSERAALVLPHASRTLDNGTVEQRVRLMRPAARETMAAAELDASNWHETDESRWRSLWNAEIEILPAHTETRFWLVTGLLLPIWDRLPDKNMRVRRLTTDAGEPLLGRVLNATEQHAFRAAFALDAGPSLTGDELYTEIMRPGHRLPPRQWLAPRPPPYHERPPHRDRGTRRRRYRHPETHGLHRRNHLVAHPRLCPQRLDPRTHHRALATCRLITNPRQP